MAPASKTGFTLVEVIITLLVAVILGAIMMQYSGSALIQSSTPIKRLKINTALQAVADQIIGAFRQAAPSDSAGWSIFQSSIGAAGTDQNNAYGEYRVLFNDFIQFDAAGNEIADVYGTAPENTLKVIIAGANDDSLTFLLVR
ncbi:MAG: type II secretion system GspH family protein [Deltaproteobacteria bacterium]|nr:type II secretion system GspH family protein [Deltaproteobacteria bacterium]